MILSQWSTRYMIGLFIRDQDGSSNFHFRSYSPPSHDGTEQVSRKIPSIITCLWHPYDLAMSACLLVLAVVTVRLSELPPLRDSDDFKSTSRDKHHAAAKTRWLNSTRLASQASISPANNGAARRLHYGSRYLTCFRVRIREVESVHLPNPSLG